MNQDIQTYNDSQSEDDKKICDFLCKEINKNLPESDTSTGSVQANIWHRHTVWFLDENPIAGYSKQKAGIRLMFWSGVDFDEEYLDVSGGRAKDASVYYNSVEEINTEDIQRWLNKSKGQQRDYKNIVKRKGQLERLR